MQSLYWMVGGKRARGRLLAQARLRLWLSDGDDDAGVDDDGVVGVPERQCPQ